MKQFVILSAALGILLSTAVYAVEKPGAQSPSSSDLAPPKAGMSMRQVEKKYGKPSRVIKAVGKPPISRWIYDGFTVYFEGKYVIHSVTPHALRIKSADIGSGKITREITESDSTELEEENNLSDPEFAIIEPF